jgi:hypothetical protein
MDRASKLIVFAWTCLALSAVVYFSQPAWPGLPAYAALAFVAMAVAASVTRRAVAAVLLLTYVFPIVFRIVTGLNYSPFSAAWTAGLLGAMAPDALRAGWHLSNRWRAVLVCWALTVAAGASIVVLRELDFNWALAFSTEVANSSAGGWPSFVATWSLHAATVLLTGILWFDWLCALDAAQFRTFVALPLGASCAVLVTVALYQLFVDISFLNPTIYGALNRASGTIMDGNLLGTIAGLWIGGVMLLFPAPFTRTGVLVRVAAMAACWLAVWASGSRTGLATAFIVSSCVVISARKQFSIRAVIAALASVATVAAVVASLGSANAVGPLRRIREMAPTVSKGSVRELAIDLWERDGYGPIASAMIRRHPFTGVGVGGYHFMQADFARLEKRTVLSPDNAQNWYRHQLAELGIIGSLGWIAWVVLFGAFVVRPASSDPTNAWIARGMVAAFALISLVGVPGQEVAAAITFWSVAFWYQSLVGAPAALGARRLGAWMAVIGTVAAFVLGTLWSARTALRVPARAQTVGWPYMYGFHVRQPADGEGRWTKRHAVAVVEAPTPHLLIIEKPNGLAALPARQRGGQTPMHVELRVNGQPLVDDQVQGPGPLTKYVRLPGSGWVFIEARVNETLRPADVGMADDRELGVFLQWLFLDREPDTRTGAAP